MTVHALETIALEGSQPFTKQAATNTAVTQGAHALLAEFGTEHGKPVALLVNLALQGLTPNEYADLEKQAYALAAEVDKLGGFVKVKGAKGADAYGKKENCIRVGAVNRKKVFGVARLNLSAIVTIPDSGIVNNDTLPTMAEATRKARAYLKDNNLEWDGQPTPSDEQKTVQAENSAYKAARDAVEKANPVKPGETLADWMARIEPLIETSMLVAAYKARKEKAQTIAKGLIDKHGAAFCEEIISAMYAILDAPAAEPAPM